MMVFLVFLRLFSLRPRTVTNDPALPDPKPTAAPYRSPGTLLLPDFIPPLGRDQFSPFVRVMSDLDRVCTAAVTRTVRLAYDDNGSRPEFSEGVALRFGIDTQSGWGEGW
ncbi:hypothetical protein PSPO01_03542 [Paraphaeosphaeria sporulosa]